MNPTQAAQVFAAYPGDAIVNRPPVVEKTHQGWMVMTFKKAGSNEEAPRVGDSESIAWIKEVVNGNRLCTGVWLTAPMTWKQVRELVPEKAFLIANQNQRLGDDKKGELDELSFEGFLDGMRKAVAANEAASLTKRLVELQQPKRAYVPVAAGKKR